MISSDITFRKLEILLAYMEQHNIARAAEKLDLSTVSVHRALHSLEKGLRCPLFIHKGRNLLPMASAYILADYARQLLQLLELGAQATQSAAGFSSASIKLGTMYSLTIETVPRLLTGLKRQRPDLDVELVMGSNQELLKKLEQQQVDAVLVSATQSQIDSNSFITVPLFNDHIFFATAASTRLSIAQPIDLKNLRTEKFVALTEGFATYQGLHDAFKIAGFEPNIVTYVNDIFSMVSLVQAGMGNTLLPGRMRGVYETSLCLYPLAPQYQIQQCIALVFARNRAHDLNLVALADEGRSYSVQRDAHQRCNEREDNKKS